MSETKYGHMVKKLNFQEMPFGKIVWPRGSDLEGMNLSFSWTYSHFAGEWDHGKTGGHMHPYGEVSVYSGLDYDHPNDIGAEFEVTMGEEGEKYVFSKPTAVVVPSGFQHGPLVTRKAGRPYGVLMISLNGEDRSTDLPDRSGPSAAGGKYQHLVQNLELRDMNRKSGGNADFIAGWNGKGLDAFNLNFTWAFHTGTGAWHEKDPHVHPNDEILLFVGSDPERPERLGAEIEIAMGDEQEIHVFDTPTVVVAPKGFVHCPLITRKVDKPYCFSAICLSTEHETKWLGVQ